MRLLHTADWHVGKTVRGHSRIDEFAAALERVVTIAIDERVDAVLVAGDLYEQRVVSPEADGLIFDTLLKLRAECIPVVAICGNHDSAARFEAFEPLLRSVGVELAPKVRRPEAGGIVRVAARSGNEVAAIACVPFVAERRFADASEAFTEAGRPYLSYAEGVSGILEGMAGAFGDDTINVVLAHLFIDGARPGGGERELTMGGAYTIPPSALPPTAAYIALGHVHRPQEVRGARAPARYSGSLLQLDFGERDQDKSVYVVEARAGKPARVLAVPLEAGRKLIDVEASLDDLPGLAGSLGNAYLRVFLRTDGPVPGIADRVREVLPNALDVHLVYERAEDETPTPSLASLEPRDQFVSYYRAAHGVDPHDDLLAGFARIEEELVT
jgi:exonuclease SbcD